MKKSLFIFGASVLTNFVLLAQNTPVTQTPLNKNVVLEELTGIHCGYCPDGHRIANEIADANPGRVVLVNIHAGSYASPGSGEPDLRTTNGTAINSWMAPSGYPAGSVQRKAISGALTAGRGSWEGAATPLLDEVSPVNVAMNAVINATTRQVVVTVELFYTTPQASGVNNYLNIGILQDNFEGPQSGASFNPSAVLSNGKYLHNHIFRGYINVGGIAGETIDASQTGVITKTVTYTLPASINSVDLDISNLKFFAFIGKGKNTATTSEIYSAAEVSPTYTNVPNSTATLKSITNVLNIGCDSPATLTPTVVVKNAGSAISSLTFSTSVNGGAASIYNWTGNIPSLGTLEIPVTGIAAFTPGTTNSVVINITSVNGGSGALGTTVSATKSILKSAVSTGSEYTIEVLTDNYPTETSWELLNSSNTVVATGGPYAGDAQNGGGADALTTKIHEITLNASDCYSFKMYDGYGDGLNTGTNPAGGFGFKIKKGNTVLYSKVSSAFETSTSEATGKSDLTNGVLKLNYSNEAGITELSEATDMTVFPNPATDKVNVSFNAENTDYTISLTDISGRVLSTNNYSNLSGSQVIELSVNGITSGNYIVTVSNENGSVNKQVTIK
jgi:hypothetical protein